MNNTHTHSNTLSGRPTPSLHSDSGFTLIELLVVILILGILLAIALPTFLNQQNKAKDSSVKVQLNTTYKEAKTVAVGQNANYVTSSFTTANLATAVQKGEPGSLSVVALASGTNDETTPGTVGICSQTSGQALYAVATSSSGVEYLMTGGPGIPFAIAPGNCAGFTAASGGGSGTTQNVAQQLSIIDGSGTPGTPVPGGQSTASNLNSDLYVAAAGGSEYIADTGNNEIEKISASGVLSIIGGNGQSNNGSNPTPGQATNTALAGPGEVTADSAGDVFFTEFQSANAGQVWEIKPNGQLSLFAGNGGYSTPTAGPATSSGFGGGSVNGLAISPAGNVIIESSEYLMSVTLSGTLSVITGGGSNDFVGLAEDAAGDLFYGNIYAIDERTPAGVTTTVAGNGTNGNPVSGPATSTPVGNVNSLAVSGAGNVYFTVVNYNDVYEVSAGQLSVAVGTNAAGPPTAGPATSSALNEPAGIALDSAGNLFIADFGNNDAEKVTGLN